MKHEIGKNHGVFLLKAMGLALGLQYLVHRRINVGLDWRVRGHSMAESCANNFGGATLPFDPLQQVNVSLAYRFID